MQQKLDIIKSLVEEGMNASNTVKALALIGFNVTEEEISSFRLWNEYMPLIEELPYSDERRNLQILWESIDKTPYGMNCAFAIPFRQIIAKKLFKSCGDGFVASENCRFNFANNIEIGENVSWNAGCYIDSKGGVRFGDYSMLTEYVKIFTHSHSEWNHMERSYSPVVIGDYAKVYTNSTILPGVTIGEGGVVATGAIVSKSVEPYTLVGGIPAKVMRKRRFEGADRSEMNQYMMKDGLFQKKD